MEFLSLSRRRSSARNVLSNEERGETDVFAGYPRLLSLESTGKIEQKEISSCLITCLLVVFNWQLGNLVTTLYSCTLIIDKAILIVITPFESYGVIKSSSFDH